MKLFDEISRFFAATGEEKKEETVAEAAPMPETEGGGLLTMQDLLSRYQDGSVLGADGAFSKIGTVFACVDRRSTTLAKLPFQVFHREGDNRCRADEHRLNYLLTVRPNSYQSPMVYKKYIMTCQLLWGFACVYKKYNAAGEIEALIPWNPQEVGVNKVLNRDEYVYTYRGQVYTEDEVIYIPYLSADGKRGKAPMTVARESAEAVHRMNQHLNRFYEKGAVKQGALKVTQPLEPAAKRKLKKQWADLYGGQGNSGEVAILDNGMEWQDISLPLADAQFIESKRLTALDIATIFNVPGSSVGLAQEKFSNLQEINDRFLQDVVAPDCINIEEAHNFSCFRGDEKGYYTKFNIAAGMRGSPEKRASFYREMINLGLMTVNEARALEEWNGIGPLGDKHYASLNLTTLETLEKHERIKE